MAEEVSIRQNFLAQLLRDECPICKETYCCHTENAVRLPGCGHVVGSTCIKEWLAQERHQRTCPLCRQELFEATPEPEEESQNDEYGTVADQAIMRLAEREEDWDLMDLRSWLRRRLDPDPPSTEAEVEHWWQQGCPHISDPDFRRLRRLFTPHLRLQTYERAQRFGLPLPSLNESTSSLGLPSADQMDSSHDDALFAVLDAEGYFAHPYWQIVARGASNRELWEMLRHEMYVLGRGEFHDNLAAPFLAGFSGLLGNARSVIDGYMLQAEGEVVDEEDAVDEVIARLNRSRGRSRPGTVFNTDIESEPEESVAEGEDSVMTESEDEEIEKCTDGDQDGENERVWCICQDESWGDMVACTDRGCPTEWFHFGCVGLETAPLGDWYCPDCVDRIAGLGAVSGQRRERA